MPPVSQLRCNHLSVERPTLELILFETASTTFTMFIEGWPWDGTLADDTSQSMLRPYKRVPSELERLIQTQRTHDVICPVCQSCITELVILRKRKRNPGPEDQTSQNAKLLKADVSDFELSGRPYKNRMNSRFETEDRGCLVGLWSFLFGKDAQDVK
ncbi:hypothetical protein R1flu_010996 [Riccia fluitans]|uniref:Uncharacterized protein n=1 Tax=Riccia fluitans TaxID=41844 RepID=A0ABD1Z6K3_9MARC